MKVSILIDNDILIHKSWEFAAKKAGLKLFCFFDIDSFLDKKEDYPLESTFIYIDSELDHGILGEVEAIRIFEQGYRNLFLASGKKFVEDELPHYIKGTVSKRSPF